VRNELRNGGGISLGITHETRRNPWLGREDSNLRMTVPKTVVAPCKTIIFLRTNRLTHTQISIAYGRIADCTAPAGGA